MNYILFSPSREFTIFERGTKGDLVKRASNLMIERFGKHGYERNGIGRYIRKGSPGTPYLDLIVEREDKGNAVVGVDSGASMTIKNVTLMGIEFEVRFDDEILEAGERKAAHLDAQNGVIRIQKDMIPSAQKTNLLTHSLWFGVSGIGGAISVEIAQALAIQMYDTLRRNPDMVKWLMADDR